jgi:uncharacterized protein (DUF885 family)
MPSFADTFPKFLHEFFEANPTYATEIGFHDVDDRWPDVTEAGRLARLDFVERWTATFDELAGLSADDEIDRDLLRMELDAARFADTELREEAWDPLQWIYLLGGGLFSLISREFAPLATRLTSLAGRLEGIPAVVDGAKAALVGVGDRPVGRFQTETALKQLHGVAELADDGLREAEAAAADPAVAAVTPRLRAAVTTAKAALTDFETHLREVVLPASDGDGRLGHDLFAAKMQHTMRSDDLSPERILAEADDELLAVRAEMVLLAGQLWPTWCPDQPLPEDEGAVVRGVLDAIALDHPKAPDLIDFCRAEISRIEAFCAERDLIGHVDEPLDIRWTPVFMRAFGGAMLSTPGPLDKGEKAFFSITPIPEDWSEDQRESYLREDNARMLRLLSIHEAVPGHYLQGVYANRAPSHVRSIFWSGLFAEGWAVYVTQVMMDVGYGKDDPALLLTHWKFYLRSITNAIIDARIHVHGMTQEDAVHLMVEVGFQEEAEARAKFDRARLSSTQLSTYFAGSMEMWDIELEARRRAARAIGSDDMIDPGHLPGGFGETPGFVYRRHLESVIAHGAPPTSLLKRILFE